jgi:hypothetical protein
MGVSTMIIVNFEKAKLIAHDLRRKARDAEFAPYDAVIVKQLPGDVSAKAEEKRVEIREKYVELQAAMDSANSIDELKSLLPNNI